MLCSQWIRAAYASSPFIDLLLGSGCAVRAGEVVKTSGMVAARPSGWLPPDLPCREDVLADSLEETLDGL
jgi:hypothetical protein